MRTQAGKIGWWRRAVAGCVGLAIGLTALGAGPASGATVSGPGSAGAGQIVTLGGTGFTPGDVVTCFIFVPKMPASSTELPTEVKTAIGTTVVDPGGKFTLFVRMPYSAGYEIGKRSFFCEDHHGTFASAQVRFETDYTASPHPPLSGDDQSNGLMVDFFGRMPFRSENSGTATDRGGIFSGASGIPIGPGGTAGDGIFPTWLNNRGIAVGYESPSPGVDGGFACHILGKACAPVDPGGLGGNTFIDAINDKSQIAGSSIQSGALRAMGCTLGANLHCQTGPFNLGTLGGNYSSASALNANDLIVGQSTTSGGDYHAFSCLRVVGACDGGIQDLGTLAGGTTSNATAVNDADDIAGTALNASSSNRAFLKLPGQPMKSLGTPPGSTQSYAYGINNQDEVVGDPPFLWSNNSMFGLEKLLPSGWHLSAVNGINVFSQIAAEGHRTGADRALILDPRSLIGSEVITNGGFNPPSVTVQPGGVVQFVNNGSQSHNVKDSTGAQFFASPTLLPEQGFSLAFLNAGTFPFKDTLHGLTGTVKVPMSDAPTSGGTDTRFQLYWSPYTPPANEVYDVQVKKPGAASFASFRQGVTTGFATFTPGAGTGNYQFEARIRNTSNGHASEWSPPLTVPVM